MAMVIYDNGSETLICEVSHEETLKNEYFVNARNAISTDRDIEDYDRTLVQGTIEIHVRSMVSADKEIK